MHRKDLNSQEMESDVMLRRLHLSDLLACVFQHITKHPLLIASLMQQTQQHESRAEELERLRVAESKSRELLEHLNEEVRISENKYFLDCVFKMYAHFLFMYSVLFSLKH